MTDSLIAAHLENGLGEFLRERRLQIDSAALGYPQSRRRTSGLRREEVAQRAGISTTWYTWLEQGRGGAPSAEALDRVSRALLLTAAEREHLFLLGLGRLPESQYQPDVSMLPRLQRVIDTLAPAPAIIRTAVWDVIAWNGPALRILDDYRALPPADRNLIKRLFLDPQARVTNINWRNVAQFLVGVFRADISRAGAEAAAKPIIAELLDKSPDFAEIWLQAQVNAPCDGSKHIRHPELGEMELEFSSFAADSRYDLAMLVYNIAPGNGHVALSTWSHPD